MSAPPPELAAYHVGIVVRDVEAAKQRYTGLLGIPVWAGREVQRAAPPWRTDYADTTLHLAFGRAAGITIELIQVLAGRNQHSEYLEAHGEGAQHIGFWTPDLRASVQAALAQGATLVNGLVEENGTASVQLSATSPTSDVVRALDDKGLAYVDGGLGSLQLEFVGSSTNMRSWMGADFDRILVPPPWDK